MGDLPLYFLDYTFHLDSKDNIHFDKELKLDQLRLKEGDVLTVKIVDNRIALIKE